MIRSHEFQSGRRVFHVHFGHGYVTSLETAPTSQEDGAAKVETERVLSSKTYNIHVTFDSLKQVRLRAFYAVPKMVVIPSSSALRKRKLQQALEYSQASLPERIQHVSSLLAQGSLRSACNLVRRWRLEAQFDPTQLLQQLVEQREYAAAVRFAREFGLTKQFPTRALLHRMLQEKRYDGALKFVCPKSSSVDGEHSPADVLQRMVCEGRHEVALKYVHKFGAASQFSPAHLVRCCLHTQGELSVRTCAMLLKYVSLFKLEDSFPQSQLLERARASGVLVHVLEPGKFVVKGRRRNESNAASSFSTGTKVGSAP